LRFVLTQLKKRTLGFARILSEASWFSIPERLPHTSDVFHLFSSWCCQQGTSNL